MYEVWISKGRTRKVIAKFRLLQDAKIFVSQHPEDGELEIVAKPTAPPPGSRPPKRSTPPKSARAPGAVEHPGEFIADFDSEG